MLHGLRWIAYVLTLALAAPAGRADAGAKTEKLPWKTKAELTRDDERDTIFKKSYRKIHTFEMTAGQIYRIDLRSAEFDIYLRLEDPTGKIVARNEDDGDAEDACIVYRATRDGAYRIIATTSFPNKLGEYKLSVNSATSTELANFRMENILGVPTAERRDVVAEVRKRLEGKGAKAGGTEVKLAMAVARGLEAGENIEDQHLSAEVYTEFGKMLANADDEEVATAGKMMQKVARRVGSLGKEIEIRGKTADGRDIDLAKLKGKVVLIDFWATWCAPCRAELPNIKRMYAKYHARGFDVIGVSLDEKKAELVDYLQEEKLPWPSIYDQAASEGKQLADYYGIFSIPQAILVDQQGRVVSLHARGGNLENELSRLFDETKSKTKESAP